MVAFVWVWDVAGEQSMGTGGCTVDGDVLRSGMRHGQNGRYGRHLSQRVHSGDEMTDDAQGNEIGGIECQALEQ